MRSYLNGRIFPQSFNLLCKLFSQTWIIQPASNFWQFFSNILIENASWDDCIAFSKQYWQIKISWRNRINYLIGHTFNKCKSLFSLPLTPVSFPLEANVIQTQKYEKLSLTQIYLVKNNDCRPYFHWIQHTLQNLFHSEPIPSTHRVIPVQWYRLHIISLWMTTNLIQVDDVNTTFPILQI